MLSQQFLDRILLGLPGDLRFTQDSPVLPEVWSRYAEDPGAECSVLVTPFKGNPAGTVARFITDLSSRSFKAALTSTPPRSERTPSRRLAGRHPRRGRISYVENLVAATLSFDELVRIVLPLTQWWSAKHEEVLLENGAIPPTYELARSAVSLILPDPDPPWPRVRVPSDLARVLTLVGVIQVSALRPDLEEEFNHASSRRVLIEEICLSISHSGLNEIFDTPPPTSGGRSIYSVSLNRPAFPAVSRSVPAIKADAAQNLFNIDCRQITWAVLDSGIDAKHPAFDDLDATPAQGPPPSRVLRILDFSQIRRILAADHFWAGQEYDDFVRELAESTALSPEEVSVHLQAIAGEIDENRRVDWGTVEPLLRRPLTQPPNSDHGTHVAGILGANWRRLGAPPMVGVCPNIRLYDMRVLSATIDETEFAIIAAMQFIRFLNDRSGHLEIHGANLSLSIPHDVRNYACGRTPICEEANRLAANGVVVVAAAGNQGLHLFQTSDGPYVGYSAISVTDPGNADGVITVGATHRYRPHTYGVSYFSSRGPTGDGRRKPDLVAPGEKVECVIPNRSYGVKDGTSMAAPHVSGSAALLMARHSELMGEPARIKSILCQSATDLGRERDFQGAGMVDVLRALQSV